MPHETTVRLSASLVDALAAPRSCALCGSERIAVRAAPIGKRRLLFYALCAGCLAMPEQVRIERVEAQAATRFAPRAEGA